MINTVYRSIFPLRDNNCTGNEYTFSRFFPHVSPPYLMKSIKIIDFIYPKSVKYFTDLTIRYKI